MRVATKSYIQCVAWGLYFAYESEIKNCRTFSGNYSSYVRRVWIHNQRVG